MWWSSVEGPWQWTGSNLEALQICAGVSVVSLDSTVMCSWPLLDPTLQCGQESLAYISLMKRKWSRTMSLDSIKLKLNLWPPWVNLACDHCFLPSTWHFLKYGPPTTLTVAFWTGARPHSMPRITLWVCCQAHAGLQRAETSRQWWKEHHPLHIAAVDILWRHEDLEIRFTEGAGKKALIFLLTFICQVH